MKVLFGVVAWLVAAAGTHAAEVQIYEIRESGRNSLRLKDVQFKPKNQQNVIFELLSLLSPKKETMKRNIIQNKQLIKKLRGFQGDEGSKIGDDTYIYMLDSNIENGDNSSREEDLFVDFTRNKPSEQKKMIEIILEQLLQQNKRNPNLHNTVLRSSDINEDRTLPPPPWRYRDN